MQVVAFIGTAKSTIADYIRREKIQQFTEAELVPLRRWREIGALGNSAAKTGLIHASTVDKLLAHFRPEDSSVLSAFQEIRRTTMPPACRHRAGAADRDHLINM